MSVFFLLSADAPETTLAHVLRYTNGDRFRPLDGYKTLSTHWHLADTVQAIANGFDWTPPFKPVLKAMGVICVRIDRPEDVLPSVRAASTMAFQSGQAVAVLLGQKLIGAKKF